MADKALGGKVFQDPIHGSFEIHPLCIKIIDTPEFQRLRHIKQLGACDYVYPGACHSRFEHSLGVCYLAGRVIETLKRKHPKLITHKEVLCIKVAGLCHDLGHGPFSHMFQEKFINKWRKKHKPRQSNKKENGFKHEKASGMMIDRLYKRKHVKKAFKKYKLDQIPGVKSPIEFIKDLIEPPKKLRHLADKPFLYEIVANKETGVDVDKWDYFARDNHYLGLKGYFDHGRLINFMKIIKCQIKPKEKKGSTGRKEKATVKQKKQNHICYRDKEVHGINDMFGTRTMLYRRACLHKTTQIVEYMISEALTIAAEELKYTTKNGKQVPLVDTVDDMDAFIQVTDHVYQQILYSTDEKLKKAKKILQKIEQRDIYKCVGQAFLPEPENSNTNKSVTKIPEERNTSEPALKKRKIDQKGGSEDAKVSQITKAGGFRKEKNLVTSAVLEEDVQQQILGLSKKQKKKLTKKDIVVMKVKFDYTNGAENPVDRVIFYKKTDDSKKTSKTCFIEGEEVSKMIPKKFMETIVRVYSRSREEHKVKALKDCFQKWRKQKRLKNRY